MVQLFEHASARTTLVRRSTFRRCAAPVDRSFSNVVHMAARKVLTPCESCEECSSRSLAPLC